MGGWLPRWTDGKEGGRDEDDHIFFSFVIISVNDSQSMTHLEELQNKYGLRHAELIDLLVACAVNFPVRFLWQN